MSKIFFIEKLGDTVGLWGTNGISEDVAQRWTSATIEKTDWKHNGLDF